MDLEACRDYLAIEDRKPSGMLAAFCVGSVARGWANPGSDYDLCVVSSDMKSRPSRAITWVNVPVQPPEVPVEVSFDFGRRWEVKYWTDAQIAQMLEKVTWDRFNGSGAAEPLAHVEELFIERLLTCIPIFGEDWIEAARDNVRQSAYREFVVSRSLSEADNAIEDALGQLAANDQNSAVLSAHYAVGHTVDALLDIHGHYGTRTRKWRARRVLDAGPTILAFDDYWAYETMAELDPTDPTEWITDAVNWCRDLARGVEL